MRRGHRPLDYLSEVLQIGEPSPQSAPGPLRPLGNPRWERFAQLLLEGTPTYEAYDHCFDTAAKSRLTRGRLARELARHPEVVRRLAQLRKPVIEKALKKFEYTVDMAMEECDQAHALAEIQRSPEKMLKAIELKAKLMKILVSVSETKASPIDATETKELVELLGFVREMKARELATIQVSGGIVKGEGREAPKVVDVTRGQGTAEGTGAASGDQGPSARQLENQRRAELSKQAVASYEWGLKPEPMKGTQPPLTP